MSVEYKVVVSIGHADRKYPFARLETTTSGADLDQLASDIQNAVEQYEFESEEIEAGEHEDQDAA